MLPVLQLLDQLYVNHFAFLLEDLTLMILARTYKLMKISDI